jgi:hypothetical protein
MNQTYLNTLPAHIDAGTLVTIVPCSEQLEATQVSIDASGYIETTPSRVIAWQVFSSGLSMPVFTTGSQDVEAAHFYKIAQTWFRATYQGAETYESLTEAAKEHQRTIMSQRAMRLAKQRQG